MIPIAVCDVAKTSYVALATTGAADFQKYRKIALTFNRIIAILNCGQGIGGGQEVSMLERLTFHPQDDRSDEPNERLRWRSQIKEVTMPTTEVVFFADEDGAAPLLTWLDQQGKKVQDKCLVKIERLEELGLELRRPEADYLRDDIYELRVRYRTVNYRMLYFFTQGIAVISHGLVKEGAVPERDICLALSNKAMFEHHPEAHTYKE